MKAAVVRRTGDLSIEDVELAEPGTGEIRVRLIATGVCHTDLSVLRGNLPVPLPAVLGHEGAGIVDAVGPGVSEVSVDDHVLLSITIPCGRCFQCRVGNPSLCETFFAQVYTGNLLDGTSRLSKDGETLQHLFCQSSFAEYAVVPVGGAVKIRPDAPLEIAAVLSCGAMTGIGAVVNRAGVRAGESIVVVGVGGVGLAAVMGARAAGAYPIVAVDLNPDALQVAVELGASHIINPREEDVPAKVLELTSRGADYAIDAVGTSTTIASCMQSVRAGGEVVVVGVSDATATATVDIHSLIGQKRLTGTSAGSVHPGVLIPWCIDMFMAGRLPLDKLVTRQYKLDELPQAFQDMEAGCTGRGVILHG